MRTVDETGERVIRHMCSANRMRAFAKLTPPGGKAALVLCWTCVAACPSLPTHVARPRALPQRELNGTAL